MTDEMTRKISDLSDRYGDELNEIMDRCGVNCLPDFPEEAAIAFLKELITRGVLICHELKTILKEND